MKSRNNRESVAQWLARRRRTLRVGGSSHPWGDFKKKFSPGKNHVAPSGEGKLRLLFPGEVSWRFSGGFLSWLSCSGPQQEKGREGKTTGGRRVQVDTTAEAGKRKNQCQKNQCQEYQFARGDRSPQQKAAGGRSSWGGTPTVSSISLSLLLPSRHLHLLLSATHWTSTINLCHSIYYNYPLLTSFQAFQGKAQNAVWSGGGYGATQQLWPAGIYVHVP